MKNNENRITDLNLARQLLLNNGYNPNEVITFTVNADKGITSVEFANPELTRMTVVDETGRRTPFFLVTKYSNEKRNFYRDNPSGQFPSLDEWLDAREAGDDE